MCLKLLGSDLGMCYSSASDIASVIACVVASTLSLVVLMSGKEVVADLRDSRVGR